MHAYHNVQGSIFEVHNCVQENKLLNSGSVAYSRSTVKKL